MSFSGLGFASSSVGSLIVSFVTKPLVKKFGALNLIYSAVFVQGARFFIYSYVM